MIKHLGSWLNVVLHPSYASDILVKNTRLERQALSRGNSLP